jgi:hypothetical protein
MSGRSIAISIAPTAAFRTSRGHLVYPSVRCTRPDWFLITCDCWAYFGKTTMPIGSYSSTTTTRNSQWTSVPIESRKVTTCYLANARVTLIPYHSPAVRDFPSAHAAAGTKSKDPRFRVTVNR